MDEPQTSIYQKPTLWQIPKPTLTTEQLKQLERRLKERLLTVVANHGDIRFANSLAAEDMALTQLIVDLDAPVSMFTLDTGRLHPETLAMIKTIETRLAIAVNVVVPNPADVDEFVSTYGLNGFYESEAAKKACCRARKVLPLARALSGADAWLTGQRRSQSVTRTELPLIEAADERGVAKYNPLFDVGDDELWSYLHWRGTPISPLHQRGYPSVGCEPCTRAVRADEDVRAGRWWWLQADTKECGLHVVDEPKNSDDKESY